MSHPWWLDVAEAGEKLVTALAIACGGGWALYRFGLRREAATALSIDLKYATFEFGSGTYLVTLDVRVRNMGRVRLIVRRARDPAYPRSAKEDTETLKYGADLLIRRIRGDAKANRSVQWFDNPNSRSPLEEDLECDLASEYEQNGATDFWLEPKESYHLTTRRVLTAGCYLAMVTFVGDKDDTEFWRRVFTIQIPRPGRHSRSIGKLE